MTEKMKPMSLTETTDKLGGIIGRNSAVMIRAKARMTNHASSIAPPGATHYTSEYISDAVVSHGQAWTAEKIVFFCLPEGDSLPPLIKLLDKPPSKDESDE